ncbi:MAG: hypothetical protein IJF12_01395 [Alphaproteobacteria bacterium]|nr:hypothetical protein [Alphaproteobacteria bacterium]
MAVSTANATTNESAEIQVTGNVVITSSFSCNPLDFGTIYLKAGENGVADVGTVYDDGSFDGSVVNVDNFKPAMCTGFGTDYVEDFTLIAPSYVELTGVESGTDGPAYLNDIQFMGMGPLGGDYVVATLHLPAGLSEGGEISGSFSVTLVQ